MSNKDLDKYFNDYESLRMQNDHRYNSFDYCFNYFSSFDNKKKIANDENIETSCLQLGFYLASWGMLRGSGKLLEKSLGFYIPMIETIANCNENIWKIDVDKYNCENQQALVETYSKISEHIPQKTKLTLATKIMLGVFGNVPAFDTNFKLGMQQLTNMGCKFENFEKSLVAIYRFYSNEQQKIDNLAKTKTNAFGFGKSVQIQKVTRAKVIDIIGFQCGLQYLLEQK